MASDQLSRRENTTNEREIQVEKDRVPKMTTHFEQLTVQQGGADHPPQGNIATLQGGVINKDHAGKAIGDVGGIGKARETHELGVGGATSHFESLADKTSTDDRSVKQQSTTKTADKGREAFGGAHNVGKFEMKSEGHNKGDKDNNNREKLDSRTRVISGTPQKNKERNIGEVVAEKGIREVEKEDKLRGRVGAAENQGPILERSPEFKERGNETKEEEEKRSSSTLEEISKYRNQAQQSAMEALSSAQERYQRAKQATNETLTSTAQTAQERAAQAKDIAMEKTSQAKDVTLEKGQQGYEATKDTISSATKTAAEYTSPVVEKAKIVTVQAKDVTVETGKTAAGYAGKVAVDLKDKAMVAGWTAANYSAELTVEGTKKAAGVVEGAAGYAGHKAAELAAKSVDVVKGLAASAGETAKDFTARKKEESWRDYEAKRQSQPQEGEERTTEGIGQTMSKNAQSSGGRKQGTGTNVMSAIGETVTNVGEKVKKPFENMTSSGNKQSSGQGQGEGNEGMTTTNVGEKLGDVAQSMKKPLDNITEGGGEILGAVTETVGNIGNTMIEPAEKARVGQGGEGGGGGVLDAIGETIAEIAQTTKVMVVGEGDKESAQNIGSDQSRSSTGFAKRGG